MTALQARTPNIRTLRITGMGAAALAVAMAGAGIMSRAQQAHGNAQWAQVQSIPTVSLARLESEKAGRIDLPGTVQPFQKAQIYARVSGYLKSWQADIGTPVHAGQTLAMVDTPDLDQQLAQARGDLEMAKANARLADLTAGRWKALQTTGAVSQQVIDEKAGDSSAKRAAVDAALGKLRSIEALAAYKRIASPFNGIVTARKTDIGALINAGATGQELFEISDLSRLRIYVQVPQALAAKLSVGQSADFTVPEAPGKVLHAQVAAISHALDAGTRTMLVQLQADNPGAAIGSGSYCQVTFQTAATGAGIRVPSTALVVGDSGSQVAVVGADGKVVMRRIQLGRDDGAAVEVLAGLSRQDRVIDSPPETLRSGDIVHVAGGQ